MKRKNKLATFPITFAPLREIIHTLIQQRRKKGGKIPPELGVGWQTKP